MEKVREILRICLELNYSLRDAAIALGVSKTTVGEYLAEFKRTGLSYQEITKMSDKDVIELFEKSNKSSNPMYEELYNDFEYIEKELKRTGVTLYLLWEEYKQRTEEGFSYSRFCHHYKMWKRRQDPDMHMEHKAGEITYMDYTGKKMQIMDPDTGEIREAEGFVSILGASQLTYVEFTESQKLEDWIWVNENAFIYYGGVTKGITPDSLKSAVTKACKYEPLINETYNDLARHYGTVVLPTRPAKPKDKPLAENAVKLVYQRIFAPLRNMTFHSLRELNEAAWELLEKHNNTPFQKRATTRRQLFEEIEKSELLPLPTNRYELKRYQVSRVEFNYHVYLKEDKHYYSVPYQYTGVKVKTIYSSRMVELFKDNVRIAIHQRNRRPYWYTTKKEHMPQNHQLVAGWNPHRLLSWAEKMGGSVKEFIQLMLDQREHPQQAFKACLGVLNLGKKYDDEAMQLVCKKAIEINSISQRFIANSLKNKTYKTEDEDTGDMKIPFHENIRGKEKYK
ncbi:MAG: IS21 family transposase [Bacteroidales bacterium]|nr:IS21 family transposase [Bacteroidales bacterium]